MISASVGPKVPSSSRRGDRLATWGAVHRRHSDVASEEVVAPSGDAAAGAMVHNGGERGVGGRRLSSTAPLKGRDTATCWEGSDEGRRGGGGDVERVGLVDRAVCRCALVTEAGSSAGERCQARAQRQRARLGSRGDGLGWRGRQAERLSLRSCVTEGQVRVGRCGAARRAMGTSRPRGCGAAPTRWRGRAVSRKLTSRPHARGRSVGQSLCFAKQSPAACRDARRGGVVGAAKREKCWRWARACGWRSVAQGRRTYHRYHCQTGPQGGTGRPSDGGARDCIGSLAMDDRGLLRAPRPRAPSGGEGQTAD